MIDRLRALLPTGATDTYRTAEMDTDRSLAAEDAPGTLIGVRPHAENGGMADMAGVLQSVHDVTTDWRGRNTSPASAFELWFDGEEITFWFHAPTDRSADAFRRRVATAYADSRLFVAEGGEGFPTIDAGDHVAGATLDLQRHHFYPIRHRNAEGFETDPYGVVTSEMLGSGDSAVVLQVVFQPAKPGWADGGLRSESVDDVAEGLRGDEVVGWLHPRTRPASTKDREAASVVEDQRGTLAFHADVRVLAASPDPGEAEARARAVASVFTKYYNAATEQGFADHPVAPSRLDAHVNRMHRRAFDGGDMTLTVDELASAAHIPNDEIETPRINWRQQTSGGRVPAGSQHTGDGDPERGVQ